MKGVIYGGRTEVLGLLSLPHTRLHFFLSFPCDIAVLIWAPLMVSVRKGLFQDPKISPRKMLASVPLQIRFCMSLVIFAQHSEALHISYSYEKPALEAGFYYFAAPPLRTAVKKPISLKNLSAY